MTKDIACGLEEAGLCEFAALVNASHMGQWLELELYDEGLEGWPQAFEQVMARTLDAGGHIYFNLTGIDIASALRGDPGRWIDRHAAWELQQITGNANWLANTSFYLDGVVLDAEQVKKLGIGPPKHEK